MYIHMTNAAELQQKITEAEAVVNTLRKQLDEERKAERAQVIEQVRTLIKDHELTASDLGISAKGSAKRATSDKRNVVAPKYQDPATGKTWTGRGKQPTWLSTLVTAGRTKDDFLIKA